MKNFCWAVCAVLIYLLYQPVSAGAAEIISTSSVNVTARVPGPDDEVPVSSSTVSGGRGGAFVNAQLLLSGMAYPLARLTVWRNGIVGASAIAGLDGKFKINLSDFQAGWINIALYVQDSDGAYALPYSLPIYLTPAAITGVEGIVISPTISVDKLSINQGERLRIFGQAAPETELSISVRMPDQSIARLSSDSLGRYSYDLQTQGMSLGYYQAWSRVYYKNKIGTLSGPRSFRILAAQAVDKPVDKDKNCLLKADLNGDCKVNLVDFSILAYWYKRPKMPEALDLQKNGLVDLADLSVLAYYWTG